MAEVQGLWGDFARCRGLPGDGSIRGRRGTAVFCRNPREFGIDEGRGGASMNCLSLLENGRNMGDGRSCHEMPECIVEGGKGQYVRGFSWSDR